MAGKISVAQMEELQEKKSSLLKEMLYGEPPEFSGEKILGLWDEIYDTDMQNVIVETVSGPSSDENPVFPYEKLQAVVKDGGNWKWPRMWQGFDEVERRGEAFREGEPLNFKQPNKNPNIVAQKVLVVGGGPIGIRMAIELVMGGHLVTLVEKRRELNNEDGSLKALGFTNRINRPHMWPFVRNDLGKLNGKDLLSTKAAYPVFTEPETSSIGIDELQLLLLKNALLLGVDFRLGVGYVNSSIKYEEDTMKPAWNVELKYDGQAAAKYGVDEGINMEEFDCLIGCDSARSTVREKQQKYFGNVEKRKFMDCVGIVANVLKVQRKRLKELGFEHGQEPSDMNRTKMVFKEFFGKIQDEADADIENLIYYKASTHNYTILVPKRADLQKHGLSGGVYTFHEGRDGASSKQTEEKLKLKDYCRRVLVAAGIPVDEELPNGGFVKAPNDCMAFDFAECWNTKKSLHFELPPPNFSVEEDGEWEGKRLVPFIALAGDSLLEPFWPMGLGLKRGWQAIMDVNYCIDNMYNATCFMEKLGKTEEDMDWSDHFEALQEQAASNFEMCNRLQVSEELALGEYADKSMIMTQLKKRLKDPEKPPLLVEIDPWTRYAPLYATVTAKQRAMTREERDAYIHPVVQRAIARKEYLDEISTGAGGGKGEIDYKGKKLISINGKVVGGFAQAGAQKKEKKGIGMGKAPASRRGKKGTDQATGAAQQGTAADMGSMAAAMMAAGAKKKAAGEEVTFEA